MMVIENILKHRYETLDEIQQKAHTIKLFFNKDAILEEVNKDFEKVFFDSNYDFDDKQNHIFFLLLLYSMNFVAMLVNHMFLCF